MRRPPFVNTKPLLCPRALNPPKREKKRAPPKGAPKRVSIFQGDKGLHFWGFWDPSHRGKIYPRFCPNPKGPSLPGN